MHILLQRILGKRQLKVEDLDSEEKSQFDKWNAVLVGEELTVEKIVEFCQRQKGLIEHQWETLDNSTTKNERLILLHTVYNKLTKLFTADERERRALEQHIETLLDTNAPPGL